MLRALDVLTLGALDVESWATHFALLLKFRGDSRPWLCHRHQDGVRFHPVTDFKVPFSWERGEVVWCDRCLWVAADVHEY